MNEFEFYISEGKVKKQIPDKELAKSLLRDATERVEKVSRLDIKSFSKIILENIYDALRGILDALLAVDGYKSYSHEASIIYLKKYGFEDSVITELDNFRQKRNSSKYYGKGIPADDAAEIFNFYKKHSKRMMRLAEDKLDNRSKK